MLKKRMISLSLMSLLVVQISMASEKGPELIGVSDPVRAEYNWVMKCQGCHGVDAQGSKDGAPNMVGVVSQFLHSEEGRAFLGRVPGVAFVDLPAQDVAELLNWLTQTFDKEHMPENFKPYSEGEVKYLREEPLISKAFSTRERIFQKLRLPP